MEVPDLASSIVDTYVPVTAADFSGYLDQLRRDVLPHIRKLQSDGQLRWYSFLIHDANMLKEHEPSDGRLFIHLYLQPTTGLDLQRFKGRLPGHFEKPQQNTLGKIGGVDEAALRDRNWAHAWKILGEASEWVLCLLEGHGNNPISLPQVVQFLHFVTNPLLLGHKCRILADGYLSF